MKLLQRPILVALLLWLHTGAPLLIGISDAADPPRTWHLDSKRTKLCAVFPYGIMREELNQRKPTARCLMVVTQWYKFLPYGVAADRDDGQAFWVLDAPADGKIEDAVPVGVVHPVSWQYHTDAPDIVYCEDRNQYYLVLAGIGHIDLTVRLFQLDVKRRINGTKLDLSGDSANWPAQLTLAAEMRTEAPFQYMGTMRALPMRTEEGPSIQVCATSREWNPSVGVTYRYSIKNQRWTMLEFNPTEREIPPALYDRLKKEHDKSAKTILFRPPQ